MEKLTVVTVGVVALVIGLGQQVDTAACFLNVTPLLSAAMSLLHWLFQWLA